MTMAQSRQQRRALERHAQGVDLATASDRRWFEEHPGRRFRVRRMTAAEIGTAGAVGKLSPQPAGTARFTLVRKDAADRRTRIFIFGPVDKSGFDTSDAVAAALWEHHLRQGGNAQRAGSSLAATMIAQDHRHQGDAA